MKTIFTVQTQHDGLQNACFTNIKALYEFLTVELEMSDGVTRVDDGRKDVPCTYSNLVKAVRFNQKMNRFCVAQIDSDIMGSITISELGILSK